MRLEELLDDKRVAKLRPLAITEVTDLVGALEADHDSVGRLLDLDRDEVDHLHARALARLPVEVRKAFGERRARPQAMGAWDPDAS